MRLQALQLRQSFCIVAMAAAAFGMNVATRSAWQECHDEGLPSKLVTWPHMPVLHLPATKCSIWLTPSFVSLFKEVTAFLQALTELRPCQLTLIPIGHDRSYRAAMAKPTKPVILSTLKDFFELIRKIKRIQRHKGIGFANFGAVTKKRALPIKATSNQPGAIKTKWRRSA